jgi:hypothetical protein
LIEAHKLKNESNCRVAISAAALIKKNENNYFFDWGEIPKLLCSRYLYCMA